jgi:hypothetical protein
MSSRDSDSSPTMQSLLNASPAITQLIDDDSGKAISAQELVGSDRTAVLRLKHGLHISRTTGEGQILCALCGVAVYLCAMPDSESFYFKHFHEDGNCPAITRGGLTIAQINALKFHGQRESKRHIRLKTLLAESLAADAAWSEPVVEGTWKGKDGKDYRRPDVRSRFFDRIDVAFEVQLSTTFGKVMAEREVFYRAQGGLLLWVFGEFSIADAKLMMEVVFAVNNRNAFIVSEATRDASREAGVLMLECCWAQPARREDMISWTQHRKLVRFDELTLDQERQRVFYVDTDRREAELIAEIQGPSLAMRMEDFWLSYEAFDGRQRPEIAELDRKWEELTRLFDRNQVSLAARYDQDFKSVMRVLYLAKLGRAVGWDYKQFWPAAHHVFDAEKPFLWIFIPALNHYGRLVELEAMDRKGKWAWKMDAWGRGTTTGDASYNENHRFDEQLRLIFPELAHLMVEPLPF